MKKEFNITTEGVLVLASSNALKKKYSTEEFDYDFPEGFSDLSESNSVIALMTSDGGDLRISTQNESPLIESEFDKIMIRYLNILEQDKLLIMSHGEFTMICCYKQGDYKKYGRPIKFAKAIEPGRYKVEFGINDVSKEFDTYEAYFLVKINIMKTTDSPEANNVDEIW